MTPYEIIITIAVILLVIFFVVKSLIDRKSSAKMILDLLLEAIKLKVCRIEPKEFQDLILELYDKRMLTRKAMEDAGNKFKKATKG